MEPIQDDIETVRLALNRLGDTLEFPPDPREGFEDGQGRSSRVLGLDALDHLVAERDRLIQALERIVRHVDSLADGVEFITKTAQDALEALTTEGYVMEPIVTGKIHHRTTEEQGGKT